MKWKGFIPFIILTALVSVFFLFMLEGILHRGIERAGSAIWGARVELDDLNLSLSPLGVKISGFTVASREEEYKNFMEVSEMDISILTAPLLEKKLVIENISGESLAYNTERKTSGFLTVKGKELKPSEKDSIWREKMGEWLENVKDRASERIDVASYFDVDELQSLKKLNKAKDKTLEFEKGFSLRDNTSRGEKIIEELGEISVGIGNIEIRSIADVKPALNKIDESRAIIFSAEEFINDTREEIERINKSAGEIRDLISSAAQVRDSDMRALMAKMKLPSVDSEDIAATLFGDLLVERVNRLISGVLTVRRYIPPKKYKVKSPTRPRSRGIDIHFPRNNEYPSFLIKRALLTGSNQEELRIEGLTNAAVIYGKPVEVYLRYSGFRVRASFDRSTDKARDTIEASVENFRVVSATGNLNISALFTEQNMDIGLLWEGRGLLPAGWLEFLNMEDPQIILKSGISGSFSDMKIDLNSNLDRIISEHLRRELEQRLNAARREAEELINREISYLRSEVSSMVGTVRSDAENELSSIIRNVEEERERVITLAEHRRKEVERLLDESRGVAEEKIDEIRGEAEDRLRRLFR